ncbi:MAG: 30S ribosomal protein S5, partial [Chloroflexota bacterium]|nr:30S ribosomal protein S5 [Chloroflexota bacterium]
NRPGGGGGGNRPGGGGGAGGNRGARPGSGTGSTGGTPGGGAAGGNRGRGGNRSEGGGEGSSNDGRRRDRRDREPREEREELDERVVDIKRVAKVIKGGRRFAFRTVVVVGDNKGRIGIGVGKARAVPDSIRKGTDRARRKLYTIPLSGTTIPHPIIGEYGGAKVLLKPAAPGTGVIAGGGVRAVLEAVGVRDILTKSQGSSNLLNVAMATLMALQQLYSPEQRAAMRGVPINRVRPFWEREKREPALTPPPPADKPTE